MRKVKQFEEYLNEAGRATTEPVASPSAPAPANPQRRKRTTTATAEVVGTQQVQIPNSLAVAVEEAPALHEELIKRIKEFEDSIAPIRKKLSAHEELIMKALEESTNLSIKVGKVIAKIKQSKGRTTYKYKNILEEMLPKYTKAQMKLNDELMEKYKTDNDGKKTIEYEIEESKIHEGVMDMIHRFVAFVKKQFAKLKPAVNNYNDVAKELIAASEKEGLI
jgi:phenylalanyl-tRNA synthetase alpha subunit